MSARGGSGPGGSDGSGPGGSGRASASPRRPGPRGSGPVLRGSGPGGSGADRAPARYSSAGPPDPKLEPVRRLMDSPHPVVPPGLTARAAARGGRLLRRRRAARALGWAVLACAAVAFAVWAAVVQPWQPVDRIVPPGRGW